MSVCGGDRSVDISRNKPAVLGTKAFVSANKVKECRCPKCRKLLFKQYGKTAGAGTGAIEIKCYSCKEICYFNN